MIQITRVKIWRVQVRIFLLKPEILISQGTNYKLDSSYQFDLKHQNKEIKMKLLDERSCHGSKRLLRERFGPPPSIDPRQLKWQSTRLEIWRFEVRIPVQVLFLVLNFKIEIKYSDCFHDFKFSFDVIFCQVNFCVYDGHSFFYVFLYINFLCKGI